MNDQYTANLYALLQQSTAPDTAQIKAATATLNKEFYKSQECIPALFAILEHSTEQPIRQLAGVELRKRISQKDGALWVKVSQDQRLSIKAKCLAGILAEQVTLVRNTIARVISAIADLEVELNTWPELQPWLSATLISAESVQREIGSFVLFTSVETFINHEPTLIKQFLIVFKSLIADSSFEVCTTTLRSLGVISQYLERENVDEIKLFQGIIPSMLNVIQAAVSKEDVETVRNGADVFETLLILEIPLLSKETITPLVVFFTTIASNRAVSDEIRVMALNVLTWTIKYKKSKVQSLNLASDILEHLLIIGAEDEPEDLDEDCPSRLAFRAIDALAGVLPPNLVFKPLMALVQTYTVNPDPHYRKSALTALGVSVEGCSEFMRPHMSEIWPYIDRGFEDPEPSVRKAACIAFGCICEWLEEECVSRHTFLMPKIMQLVQIGGETQTAACTALDAYLEILGDEIKIYLDVVMQQLKHLLLSTDAKVKLLVMGAIGSAAHASGKGFVPYFTEIMNNIEPYFQLKSEGTELDLRGVSTDAMGTFAEAVGKEHFAPYLDFAMAVAYDGVKVGSARLKECSFLLFGVLARVFEADFARFVPEVAAALINSTDQAENGEIPNFGAEFAALIEGNSTTFGTGAAAKDEADDEIDMDDDESEENLKVNSAIAVEKEIAADTMGTVFAAVGQHYLPYLESSVNQLVKLLDHYYEGIRKSAVTSLLEFVRTFYSLSTPTPWQPGRNVVVPLHQRVDELIESILPALISMWESEDDKTVGSNLCSSLAETISAVGPGFVVRHLEELELIATQILEQKSLCQQDPDEDGDADAFAEEQAEFEGVLISTATDLVAALASVLGPDFVESFAKFRPLVSKYYSPTRTVSDRTSSIGSLGEIITGMKGGITPFTGDLFQTLSEAFKDTEPEVRSNAAFAVGALVENTEADLSNQYPELLRGLSKFFEFTSEPSSAELNARDNAAGAVSRMILKNSAAVPIAQVFPALIAALPLKNDYLENRPVYRAISHLFNNLGEDITKYMLGHVDQLLPIFVSVLDPASSVDQLGEEGRQELIGLIAKLNTVVPDKIAHYGLQALL